MLSIPPNVLPAADPYKFTLLWEGQQVTFFLRRATYGEVMRRDALLHSLQQGQNEETYERLMQLLLEVVVGWEEVVDAHHAPIPFSGPALRSVLTACPTLLDRVLGFCRQQFEGLNLGKPAGLSGAGLPATEPLDPMPLS